MTTRIVTALLVAVVAAEIVSTRRELQNMRKSVRKLHWCLDSIGEALNPSKQLTYDTYMSPQEFDRQLAHAKAAVS